MNLEESEISTENNSHNVLYYGIPTVATLTLLLAIIMVSALVGNFLVISTILKNRLMRTRTNLLLCNLAVADFFTALLDIPVAIHTLNLGTWPYSEAFCAFNGYLVGLGLMLSIHTLMWISIHKFISITRPLSRTMTPGKIFCMIVAAWAWALLYNLGPVLGWTDIVYKRGASQCGPTIPKTYLQISHSATNTIFNFLLPVTVMSYCYYKIFSEVKEHMNRLGEFSDSCVVSTILQQRRITNTLLIVFLCFLVCWSPYIVYSCMLVTLGEPNVKPIFNPMAYLATYLNSACNPIIYALRSPSFRKAFHEILFCSPAARQTIVRITRNVKLAPKHQLVFEDKPKVKNPEKHMPTPVSKNKRSIGFPERRASLTHSNRNQSVSSASKRLTESLPNKGSQKWNWRAISLRWSIARSKSASEVAAFKNGQKPRPSIAPNSIPSNEYPSRHRRINTLPVARMEGKKSSNPTPQTPNTTQLLPIKHLESSSRNKSMVSCHSPTSPLPQGLSNLTNPALKPSGSHLMDEEESSFQRIDSLVSITNPGHFLHPPFSHVAGGSLGHENDCTLPQLNDTLNLPRNKKYSVYFSTFMNRPLSFSAPDLIMTGNFGFIEEHKDGANEVEQEIENKGLYLKVPQISFLRTCSDGSVQTLLSSDSRSQFYRKEVPQLVWQASLENITTDGIPRLKRTKYGYRRRLQVEEGMNSTRTFGVNRDTRLHNLLNSVECVFSNIFTHTSLRQQDHPNSIDQEKGSRSVFYTPDKTSEQKTLVQNVLMSNL